MPKYWGMQILCIRFAILSGRTLEEQTVRITILAAAFNPAVSMDCMSDTNGLDLK